MPCLFATTTNDGPRPDPNPLGDRVDDPLRVRRPERGAKLGDLRDGPGDRKRLLARLPVELGTGLEDRNGDSGSESEDDDRQLEQEDLRRQPQAPPTPPSFPRHPSIVGAISGLWPK